MMVSSILHSKYFEYSLLKIENIVDKNLISLGSIQMRIIKLLLNYFFIAITVMIKIDAAQFYSSYWTEILKIFSLIPNVKDYVVNP